MSYATTTYPYGTVVQITDTLGGSLWQGSGVLISPDEVLTASHVVYRTGMGTATNIVVAPGYNAGAEPYGTFNGTYFHYFLIDDQNDLITPQQSQFDYAVIHLSSSVVGAGYMGLLSNYSGGLANITGYPASAGGAQVNSTETVYHDPSYTLLDGTSLGRVDRM